MPPRPSVDSRGVAGGHLVAMRGHVRPECEHAGEDRLHNRAGACSAMRGVLFSGMCCSAEIRGHGVT